MASNNCVHRYLCKNTFFIMLVLFYLYMALRPPHWGNRRLIALFVVSIFSIRHLGCWSRAATFWLWHSQEIFSLFPLELSNKIISANLYICKYQKFIVLSSMVLRLVICPCLMCHVIPVSMWKTLVFNKMILPSCWNKRAAEIFVTGIVELRGGWRACRSPAPIENLTCGPPVEGKNGITL